MDGQPGRSLRAFRSGFLTASRRVFAIALSLCMTLGTMLLPPGGLSPSLLMTPQVASAATADILPMARMSADYWNHDDSYGVGVGVDGYGNRYVLIEFGAVPNRSYWLQKYSADMKIAWNIQLAITAPSPRIEVSKAGEVFVSGVTTPGTFVLQRLDPATGYTMWERKFSGCETNIPPALSLDASGDWLFYCANYGAFAKIYKLDRGSGRGSVVVDTQLEAIASATQAPQCNIFDIAAEATDTLYAVGHIEGASTRGWGACENYGEYVVLQYGYDGAFHWSRQNFNAEPGNRSLAAPVAYEVGVDDTGACYTLVRELAGIGQAGDNRVYWYLVKNAYNGAERYGEKVSRFGGSMSMYQINPDPGTARLAVSGRGVPYVVCNEVTDIVGTLAYTAPYIFRLDDRGLVHSQQRLATQNATFEDLVLGDAGFLYVMGTTEGKLDASPDPAATAFGPYLARYRAEGDDTDGDGLPDEWEIYGYTGANGKFVDLPAMGADPLHKDVFVQVNAMWGVRKASGETIRPDDAVFAKVIKAFADSPAKNPDGTTGINLHVDAGPESVMNPKTGETWGPKSKFAWLYTQNKWKIWDDFDAWKKANFPFERWPIFHYCAFADVAADPKDPAAWIAGMAKGIGSSDFFVGQGTTTLVTASTFMHELGHNLGLWHGGNSDINYKPNYLSIMNYSYELDGLTTMTVDPSTGDWTGNQFGILDYSRFGRNDIAVLDEAHLNERRGFMASVMPSPVFQLNGPDSYLPRYLAHLYYSVGSYESTTAIWPTDFNRDGTITAGPVQANLNAGQPGYYANTSKADVLESFNDWQNLRFDGGNIGKTASSLGQDVSAVTSGGDPPLPQAPEYGVSVIEPLPLGLIPGYFGKVVLTVRNVGSNDDTYTLDASSSAGWTDLSIVPATVALRAGQERSFEMTVGVPVGSAVGTQDVVRLTATSTQYGLITSSGAGIVSATKSLAITPSVIATLGAPMLALDEGFVYERYYQAIMSSLWRFDPAGNTWGPIPFSASPYYFFPSSNYLGGFNAYVNIAHGRVIASMGNSYSASWDSPSRLWYTGLIDTHSQILTTASMVATHPVVWTQISQSGDWAAWSNEWPAGADTMQEIHSWNLTTNQQRLIYSGVYSYDTHAPRPEDMDGSRFVWFDDMHPRLLVYDMSTDTTINVPLDPGYHALHPVISGNRVAWIDAYSDPQHRIHVYDLSTGQSRVIATVPNWSIGSASSQLDISGDRVMWSEGTYGAENIFVYDLKTDTRLGVTAAAVNLFNSGAGTGNGDGALLSGDTLIWNAATDTPHGTQYLVNYVKLPTGSVAPVTSIAVDPSSPDSGHWYSHEATITFTTDQLNATTLYQWDGTDANSWSTYHGAFASIEGSHTLNYYSSDALGNKEAVKSIQIRTDTIAPVTVASSDESHIVLGTGTYPSAPAITLTTDEPATTSFQWDGTDAGGWTAYAGPVTAPEGAHVLYFFSTDPRGNVEQVRSAGFNVDSSSDSVPPTVELTVTPAPDPDGTIRTGAWALASSDETAAIYLRWDSSDGVGDPVASPLPDPAPITPGDSSPHFVARDGWTLFSGPLEVPDGAHVLYAYAFDVHGNRSAVTSLTLDVQIPAGVGAPVLGSVDDTTTKAGVPLSFTLQATDPQSLPVTYSAFALPAGASLDPTTGAFVWTPSPDQQGPVFVTFSAGNGQLSDSLTMLITVAGTALNSPPVGQDTSVWTYAGAPVAVTLAATDPDGDPLVWGSAPSSAPAHGALSGTAPALTYTPVAGYVGADSFAFEVSDGRGGTTTAHATVDVRALPPVNTAPVLDAVATKSARVGSLLSFSLHAVDPEGGSITYASPLLPSGAAIDPATGLFTWTPVSGQEGAFLLTVTASDGELVASRSFTVNVAPAEAQGPAIVRVNGADSYQVAIDSSRLTFAAGSVHTVVLAGGASWGDALAAAGLAGAYRSPVLLTGRSSLPGGLVTEIRRLGAKHVVIVGSTTSVSTSVRNKLASSGLSVTRVSGGDRYEVAKNVALRIESVLGHGKVTAAFVVRGDAWFDAMSVSALAYERKAPILFTPPSYLRGVTASAIRTLAVREVIVCGGTEAVQPKTARALDALPSVRTLTRWGGPGRVETSVALTRGALARGWLSFGTVGLTSCYTYSDGLSASSAVGHRGGALLLCGGAGLLDGTRPLLLQHKPEIQTVFVFGRTRVVADSVLTGVSSLLR